MSSFVFKYVLRIIFFLSLLITGSAHAETLSQAWEVALEKNHGLKAAQEVVEATKEQLRAAKAVRLPGMSLQSGYTARDNEPQLLASLGGSAIALPVENKNSLAYRAVVSVPLYTSGRISSGIEASTSVAKAAEADTDSVRQSLKMSVADAYVSVLRAMRGLEVAKSHVASLEAHERDALSLYGQGIVAKNDVLSSQVSLADAKQQQIQAQNRLDLARAALNRLLQRPLDQEVKVEEFSLEDFDEDLTILVRKALEKRSELDSLSKSRQALRHQATLSRAEDMPQIALEGGYGYQQNDYLVDESQWFVTLGLEWKLFDGGVSTHKANALSRQANALQEQQNDFASIISLQVRKAWLDILETQKRVQVTQNAISQAEENYKVNRNLYRSGLNTYTEVLNAEVLRVKSQYNYANAHYDNLLAVLSLKRAVGEL
jgi:outer membrane protein TolC